MINIEIKKKVIQHKEPYGIKYHLHIYSFILFHSSYIIKKPDIDQTQDLFILKLVRRARYGNTLHINCIMSIGTYLLAEHQCSQGVLTARPLVGNILPTSG